MDNGKQIKKILTLVHDGPNDLVISSEINFKQFLLTDLLSLCDLEAILLYKGFLFLIVQ